MPLDGWQWQWKVVFLFVGATLWGQRAQCHPAQFTYNEKDAAQYNYGLMMDAGSSGTRLHIYAWASSSVFPAVPSVVQAPIGEVPWINKTRPGISDYADDPSRVVESLAPLIQWAASKVPLSKQADTPLYMKATAGMRLLPSEQQEAILLVIRTYFLTSPFKFRSDWAQVISGMEEGVFGWVTVNFLVDSLRPSVDKVTGTYGALDLGGASTQITFVPQETPQRGKYPLILSVDLEYQLYAHSYLGYGNDQARIALNEMLCSQSSSESEVHNPCYPVGYSTSYTMENNSTCSVVGSSNSTQCYLDTKEILYKNATCPVPACAFDGVYQPHIPDDQMFYAFSSYYYLYTFYGLNSNASLDQVAEQNSYYCNLSWGEIQQLYANSSNQFLMDYCFMGTFVVALLHDGFGFAMDEQRIAFMGNIGDIELGWPLGAMLFEADILEWSRYCGQYRDCEECARDTACGWCESLGCQSGDESGTYEQCPAQWTYKQCKGNAIPLIIACSVGTAILVMLALIGVIVLVKSIKAHSKADKDYEQISLLTEDDEPENVSL